MYDKMTEKVAASIIKKIFRLVNENRDPKRQEGDSFLIKQSWHAAFVCLVFSLGFIGTGVFTLFDGLFEGVALFLCSLLIPLGMLFLWWALFSLSSKSDVEWDMASIQGKKYLFPLPFRNNRGK